MCGLRLDCDQAATVNRPRALLSQRQRLGTNKRTGGGVPGGSDGPQTMQMVFPGGVGRWDIRRSTFRERGVSHQLLVLTDLSQTLREEERTAWQRLLRVLGHELNNSLAPIKSVAGSLADLLDRQPEPADYREDMQRGLDVISSRASSLARFVESYSKLARLPQPRFETLNVGDLVRRVASLETRLPVSVVAGPEVMVQGDSAHRTAAHQLC